MACIEKRVGQDGEVNFRVKIRLRGYPAQTATFARLTDARKWAQSTEAAIREGRYFKTAESKKHTLSDLIDRYVHDVLPTKPKSIVDQGRHLQWWKDKIGSYALSETTPALIVSCRDELARGNSVPEFTHSVEIQTLLAPR